MHCSIPRTSGLDLIISVDTLTRRLEDLPRWEIDGAPEAWALLERRGLTSAVMAEAQAIVIGLRSGPELVPPPISEEEHRRRDEALWAYYLEWSAIARVAIKEASLLRKLGLGKRGRPRRAKATLSEGGGGEGDSG